MKKILSLLCFLVVFGGKAQTPKTKRYCYDAQNQLQCIRYGNGAVVLFEYDKVGNRRKRLVTPASKSNAMQFNVLGSLVSAASLERKQAGAANYDAIGQTDEQGILNAVFVPALTVGDSLRLKATGYQTLCIPVSAELAQTLRIFVPMAKAADYATTGKIINPYLKLLNDGEVTSQPTLTVEMHGKNATSYAIAQDSVWAPATLTHQQMQVRLVRGYNLIKARLMGRVDTVELEKSIYYYPAAKVNNYAFALTVNVPETHLGAIVYDFNVPIKRLNRSTETLWLLNGFHQLRFSQLGRQDAYTSASSATSYDLTLDKKTFAACGADFDFNKLPVHYLGNSSVASQNGGTINFAKVQANMDSVRLLPVSPLYVLKGQNPTSSYGLNACFDQLTYPAKAATYLAIWQANGWKKVLPEDFAAQGIAYDSTYQLLQVTGLQGALSQVVMLQRQAPIAQGVDTVMAQATAPRHWLASQLFADPDSIKNDLKIISATSDNPKVSFSYTDSSLVIHSTDCSTGFFTINITAQHDGLTVSRSLTLAVISPLEVPQISFSVNKVGEVIAKAETEIAEARFQWFLNGQAIAGATAQTFKLMSGELQSSLQVQVSDANGCRVLSAVTTGNAQALQVGKWLRLYPNPVYGGERLRVELLDKSWVGKPLRLTLTNATGKQVAQKSYARAQALQLLDLSALSAGTYYLSIRLGNKTLKTQKIIVGR